MIQKNLLKTLLFFTSMLLAWVGQAQNHVEQVLVANGGAFGTPGNKITIGSYKPGSKKYTIFDSVPGNSVTQVLIDSGFAYMATDSYLVKYNVATLQRINMVKCVELRYIAIYKDKIVATIGDDAIHLKVFKKSNLDLTYSETNLPVFCNGITIYGDSAYIALQGDYPNFNDTGKIAVEDLVNMKLKRIITLDTACRGIGDMFTNGSSIIGVSEYPYSTITQINLNTGTKNLVVFPNSGLEDIYIPFAMMDDTLYAGYTNNLTSGIGGYDIQTKKTKLDVKPGPYYGAAAIDTINHLFYYTGGSYSNPTKTWIYNYNNEVLDSFDVGIAPEGIAIDYELNTGINEKKFANQSLNIYPNPVCEILNISGINACAAEIKLIDMTGRVVFSKKYDLKEPNTMSIPVSQLAKGVYFVNIQSTEGVVSRKFIKN